MSAGVAAELSPRGSRHWVRVAGALLGVWYAFMLTYRFEILLWMIATCLPLIMMGVWIEAGASGLFPDITAVSVARYFLAVFVVRQLTVVWVIYEFEWHVNSGRLSSYLLTPVDPAWRYVTMHLGEQAARLPFFVGVVALALLLYPAALRGEEGEGWWVPSLWQVGWFVVLTYFAFFLRFLIQYTIAMLSFWFERASGFEHLSYLLFLFCSGMLFPLEVLPTAVRELLLWTPFPYLLWFPATMLSTGDVELTRGLAVLLGWGALLLALNRVAWRRGLRRYSAMGA